MQISWKFVFLYWKTSLSLIYLLERPTVWPLPWCRLVGCCLTWTVGTGRWSHHLSRVPVRKSSVIIFLFYLSLPVSTGAMCLYHLWCEDIHWPGLQGWRKPKMAARKSFGMQKWSVWYWLQYALTADLFKNTGITTYTNDSHDSISS